jgi:hypothetical protein
MTAICGLAVQKHWLIELSKERVPRIVLALLSPRGDSDFPEQRQVVWLSVLWEATE